MSAPNTELPGCPDVLCHHLVPDKESWRAAEGSHLWRATLLALPNPVPSAQASMIAAESMAPLTVLKTLPRSTTKGSSEAH